MGETTPFVDNSGEGSNKAIDDANNSVTNLIIIAVVVVVIALFCGCVIVIWYHQKKKKEAEESVNNNADNAMGVNKVEPIPFINTPNGAVQMATNTAQGEEDLCLTNNNHLATPGNMGEIYSSNDDDDEDEEDPLD